MTQTTINCFIHTQVNWLPEKLDWSTSELAVFRCYLPDFVASDSFLLAQLQPDEYDRSQRYHRPNDRRRFAYTRALLRLLIARYSQLQPTSIPLHLGQHGKPMLPPELGKHVNVAHSGDWSLLAISPSAVGVDLENAATELTFKDIATLSFSPTEQHSLDKAVDPRATFFRLWTRKEALIKATGQGISDALADIPALDGHHHVDLSLLGEPGPWSISSFDVAPDYPAGLAYQTTTAPVQFYTLSASWLSAQ
jgi:4'-phosphopantetheinyl transferase